MEKQNETTLDPQIILLYNLQAWKKKLRRLHFFFCVFVCFVFLLWFLFYLILICHFTFFFSSVIKCYLISFFCASYTWDYAFFSRHWRRKDGFKKKRKKETRQQRPEMVSRVTRRGREREPHASACRACTVQPGFHARPRFQLLSLTDALEVSVRGRGPGGRGGCVSYPKNTRSQNTSLFTVSIYNWR